MASRGKYLIILADLSWFYTLIEEHKPPRSYILKNEWDEYVSSCTDTDDCGKFMEPTWYHNCVCENANGCCESPGCTDEMWQQGMTPEWICENPHDFMEWETANFIKFKRTHGYEVEVAYLRNNYNVSIPSGEPETSHITALDWSEHCNDSPFVVDGQECNPVSAVMEYFSENPDLKFVLLVGTVSHGAVRKEGQIGAIPHEDIWLTPYVGIESGQTAPTDEARHNMTDQDYYIEKHINPGYGIDFDACDMRGDYFSKNPSYSVGRWSVVGTEPLRRMKLKTIQYTRLEIVDKYYRTLSRIVNSVGVGSDTFSAISPENDCIPGKKYLDRVQLLASTAHASSAGRNMIYIGEKLYESGVWDTYTCDQTSDAKENIQYNMGDLSLKLPFSSTMNPAIGAHYLYWPSHFWFYRGWSGSDGFSEPYWRSNDICSESEDFKYAYDGMDGAQSGIPIEAGNFRLYCTNNGVLTDVNGISSSVANPWMPTINFFCTCDLGDSDSWGWWVDNWLNLGHPTLAGSLITGPDGDDMFNYINPAGAVAHIGPSDFHLRTRYNNPLCDGFANAILDNNIEFIGEVINYGKRQLFEIYNSIVIDSDIIIGGYNAVKCYDAWYNLFGDPGLPIWRVQPDIITEPNDFILDNNETPITNLLSAQTTINATPLMTSSFRIKPTGEDVDEIVHGTYATIMYADQLIDTVFADEGSGLLHFDLINYTEWQNNNEYCNQYLEVPEVEGGPYCDAVDGCAYSTSFPPSETDGCKPVFDVWINKFTLPQYEQKHVQILIDYIYVQGCTDELDQNYNPDAVVYSSEFCSNMSIYENSIVITEINDRYVGTEFIEIFNNSNSPINLGGFRIYAIGFTNTDEMPNITIPPHEFIVLGSPESTIQLDLFNDHLVSGVNLFRWPEGNSIWNQGELIRITDPNNNEVDSVDTSLLLEWHASPQNSSWELTTLTQENGGNAYPDHWIESEFFGGTPGKRYLDWRENAWNHMLTECRGIAQCHDQSPTICQLIWESSDGICMPQYDADEVFSCVRVLELQPLVCEYWVIEFGVCLEGCELG